MGSNWPTRRDVRKLVPPSSMRSCIKVFEPKRSVFDENGSRRKEILSFTA
ncbi:hypothetical protein SS1G_04126 [Sclerotinia sclerotiorum 1980 UF-70]|uniref:Uncharacterized protein n=1 Tax=Sclerotinia sclerotiorum (strain ATCC 18683 / 1980 / Ss-1) TaxID=665079 RepID=A7EFN5_SCLS1|nr:hypothetical protein SS1G_04126 [Sclerotinia sclerotiorum 1980 UF-70]EDO01651.1 hypothetical protein SS1G_04126 [Sclerotinia sclerotiorum 1980 UF-70]